MCRSQWRVYYLETKQYKKAKDCSVTPEEVAECEAAEARGEGGVRAAQTGHVRDASATLARDLATPSNTNGL